MSWCLASHSVALISSLLEGISSLESLSLPEGQSPVFEVTIGTPSDDASYVVESTQGLITSGTTNSSSPDTFRLRRSLQVNESGFANRMNGIRVRATGNNDIHVLVVLKYNDFLGFVQLIGYASYLIHPNNIFPSERKYVYYAVSVEDTPDIMNRHSNFLLVGNHDDTSISITPTQTVRLPEDAQTNSTLVDVAAFATHNVTLDSFQTLLVSSRYDLTGSKIVSNKPLTVISGHQCAQIPATTRFCEPIYIHLLPTVNWGQQFLLAPFAGRTGNQYYKLVASEDSTTVYHRCALNAGEVNSLSAGGALNLTISSDSYCYLNASNPVFVVQIAPGHEEDSVGDAAFTMIAPTTGHVKSSSFIILPTSDLPTSYITVTILDEHFNTAQIQLDGSALNCAWRDIYNALNEEVGHGCTSSISAGPHIVTHTGENGVLSVIAYGWRNSQALGYAYLTNSDINYRKCVT